jgi:hypothetical protein
LLAHRLGRRHPRVGIPSYRSESFHRGCLPGMGVTEPAPRVRRVQGHLVCQSGAARRASTPLTVTNTKASSRNANAPAFRFRPSPESFCHGQCTGQKPDQAERAQRESHGGHEGSSPPLAPAINDLGILTTVQQAIGNVVVGPTDHLTRRMHEADLALIRRGSAQTTNRRKLLPCSPASRLNLTW